ncbi:hypothetical protein [Nonomuraea jabiensis]|uniref:Uncharacterized protein n=1 Tax=Nonomuraea jabiensis TaxID=882448 RepID=A0A7W9G190_9ACTN|nr:hypothetical protein [Nonomuraea jabiensis]MBB5775399.1 hypothetical protein [Nonomuraea jabiensis]
MDECKLPNNVEVLRMDRSRRRAWRERQAPAIGDPSVMGIKDRQSGAIKLTKIEAAQEPCPVVVLAVIAHRRPLTPGSARFHIDQVAWQRLLTSRAKENL